MDVEEDAWNTLLGTPDVLAVLRTDGSGGVLRASGVAPARAAVIAERVDLCNGAVERLGAHLGIGHASLQLVDFEGGIVVSGARRSKSAASVRGHDVVLAQASAKMGILLSRLRRLLELERDS